LGGLIRLLSILPSLDSRCLTRPTLLIVSGSSIFETVLAQFYFSMCLDFLDVITLDQRTPEVREKSMARIELLSTAWTDFEKKNPSNAFIPVPSNDTAQNHRSTPNIWANPWWTEFLVLWNRSLVDLGRDIPVLVATFGQAIFLALLLGFIFWQLPLTLDGQQSRFGFLFFIVINRTSCISSIYFYITFFQYFSFCS
jgi:hypothetical protein